jgi:hypothetical protein
MLFPDPATVISLHQLLKTKRGLETPTFAMDPQKTTRQIPLLENVALSEPHGRFTRMYSACNDVVFGRVRR